MFEKSEPYTVFKGFQLHDVIEKTTPSIRESVKDFWRRNNILPAEIDPEERARQLAMVCLNSDGEIAGVSTVYKGFLNGHGLTNGSPEPHIFFRTFIQPEDRVPYLVEKITVSTYLALDAKPTMKRFQGMVIIPDNPKLLRPGLRKRFAKEKFEIIGKTQRGIDVYCRYFTQ